MVSSDGVLLVIMLLVPCDATMQDVVSLSSVSVYEQGLSTSRVSQRLRTAWNYAKHLAEKRQALDDGACAFMRSSVPILKEYSMMYGVQLRVKRAVTHTLLVVLVVAFAGAVLTREAQAQPRRTTRWPWPTAPGSTSATRGRL